MTSAEPAHPSTTAGPTRGRGRPPKTSRQQVAREALQLGFSGLTFTRLARSLGVSEATLYSHTSDRSDLACAAFDVLVQEAPWPGPEGPWREYLAQEARTMWDLYAADPALTLAATQGPASPAAVTHFDTVATALMDKGFEDLDAVLAADTVLDLVQDVFLRAQQLLALRPDHAPADAAAPDWLDAMDPRVRAVTVDALGSPRTWFDRKLAIVLDGIEAQLAPPR